MLRIGSENQKKEHTVKSIIGLNFLNTKIQNFIYFYLRYFRVMWWANNS